MERLKRTNTEVAKHNSSFGQNTEYKRNWLKHINIMPHNRLPRILKYYRPAGTRNQGRPLKGLTDVRDRNGLACGPTACYLHADAAAANDDDHHIIIIICDFIFTFHRLEEVGVTG